MKRLIYASIEEYNRTELNRAAKAAAKLQYYAEYFCHADNFPDQNLIEFVKSTYRYSSIDWQLMDDVIEMLGITPETTYDTWDMAENHDVFCITYAVVYPDSNEMDVSEDGCLFYSRSLDEYRKKTAPYIADGGIPKSLYVSCAFDYGTKSTFRNEIRSDLYEYFNELFSDYVLRIVKNRGSMWNEPFITLISNVDNKRKLEVCSYTSHYSYPMDVIFRSESIKKATVRIPEGDLDPVNGMSFTLSHDIIQEIIDFLQAPVPEQRRGWPSEEKWMSIEGDDAFEKMWERYLRKPEEAVNKKLGISTEASLQGGSGGMSIYDETGKGREENGYPWGVDFDTWLDWEQNAAASSVSKDDYAKKYRNYIKELCGI